MGKLYVCCLETTQRYKFLLFVVLTRVMFVRAKLYFYFADAGAGYKGMHADVINFRHRKPLPWQYPDSVLLKFSLDTLPAIVLNHSGYFTCHSAKLLWPLYLP